MVKGDDYVDDEPLLHTGKQGPPSEGAAVLQLIWWFCAGDGTGHR